MGNYVHRIGRCGRAGRQGVAITFVTDGDERHAASLIKVLQAGGQTVPQGLQEMAEYHARADGMTNREKLTLHWSKAGCGEVKLVPAKTARRSADSDDRNWHERGGNRAPYGGATP